MITTKYLWCLHVLQNLERYREKDLQESVEYLWTILFADYVKCDRSVLGMPHSWQPDIVAYNRKENVWLLVELKGKPPHGNQSEAVTQVCAYAFQLLEEHPSLLLKLLLIGPWEKKYYYQYKDNDPFHVAVVNVPNLGAKIEELFESMLCWCINSPFPLLRPHPIVDEWLAGLQVTSCEEDSPSEDSESDTEVNAGGLDDQTGEAIKNG